MSPRGSRRSSLRFILGVTFSFALLGLFWLGSAPATADAAPVATTVRTVPLANSVVAAAPAELAVDLPDGAVASSGLATVFASSHKTVARGPLVGTPGGRGGLTMKIAEPTRLTHGVYSVVWTAGTASGTFAFEVGRDGATPPLVTGPKPAPVSLGPLRDGVVAWAGWITLMTFVGALTLSLLVAGPVARRIDAALVESTTMRLVRVATVAIVLFVPAVLTSLAQDASSGGGYAFGSIWGQLSDGFAGTLNAVQLGLTALAIMLIAPLAFASSARVSAAQDPAAQVSAMKRRRLLLAGTAAGGLALITTRIPKAVPADWPRTAFQTVMGCGHLLGAAVWIGGLVGLLALALPGGVAAAYRPAFWSGAIRRYSVVAMTCVASLVLSGLWLYWVHVDGVQQLFSTFYGRVLGVKLIVFGALLLLGMFNQFWLGPKIDALRVAGDGRSLTVLLSRHFRTAIALEVLLGFTVLMIVPFLGGSARNQAFQDSAADLTRTAQIGTGQLELTPSGLQPGRTEYTVRLPDDSARSVTLSFASSQLAVPTQQVVAQRTGPRTYQVAGYYTAQVGLWQVGVNVDGNAPVQVTLPITAKPAKLKKAPAPEVRWTTWAFGAGETIAVITAMLAAFRISGTAARRRAC